MAADMHHHPENDAEYAGLQVNAGVEQPPVVNPYFRPKQRQPRLDAQAYIDGILAGDITILSKAITLVESSLPTHQKLAQEIIAECIPYSGKALRLGITGVPGAGKSTFIEALGMELCRQNKRIAVLAIDPSSQRSKGSILGDKTRMEELSQQPNAYIRPSASAGTLGGVARKTREAIILCEAAGFDTIIVETVGVGQSETAVYSMVDYFLLLLIGGAGDELQGIKRGIMEMADGIVVNKADGDNVNRANRAAAEIRNAVHLFPPSESGQEVKVTTCSATTHFNVPEVWNMVLEHVENIRKSGYLEEKRARQDVQMMLDTIESTQKSNFYENANIKNWLGVIENNVQDKKISAYEGARRLLELYEVPQSTLESRERFFK